MKVIVIGFSKTGTKSMHAALKKLGYKVYDYEHNFYYLRKEWIKILSEQGGTKADFYRMYEDVDATMDVPACVFWREILEAFPDAKLIFNDRKSVEEWWKSWAKTARNANDNKMMAIMTFLSPTAYSFNQYTRHVARSCVGGPPGWFWQMLPGVSPIVAKKCFRNHNAGIRQYQQKAVKGQLLDFHPADGWEPLCNFLGKPIPDERFPYKNKGGSVIDDLMKESPVFHQMKKELIVTMSVILVIVATLLYRLLD